jgi:HD-GYP domain-containing protein (c-di-GMP phosphodiesterase class II)
MPQSGSAATTSAADLTERRWADRRLASWILRALVIAIPVLASLAATRLYLLLVNRPTPFFSQVVFWIGALAVSIVVSLTVDRWSRRLLPLAVLFRMSLVFPDEAPSRFRVALREGNSKKLEAKLEAGELSTEGVAAQNLIALVGVLSRHDRLTRGHSERVRAYAELIGAEMGLEGDDLEKLRWGALIHDIGKLTVPSELLNKPGKPTDEEWTIIRGHPGASAAYLGAISAWLGEWSLAAEQHHERWDGAGYPSGLAGEEISLAGRIVGVADAYDVMTSARSYKKGLSPTLAREELARNAGTQFDPVVVRAMLKVSLGKLRLVLGPLGWLNELAWVTHVPQAATTAVVTATTAAAVSVGAVITLEPPVEPAEPVERIVAIETPTTTVAPPTTITPSTIEPAPSTTAMPTTTTRSAMRPSGRARIARGKTSARFA